MNREHNGSKAMIFDGLDLLLKKRNGPCLSIVVEFFGEPTRRKYNEGILKAALDKASLLLANYDCPAKDRNYVIAELQRFSLSFDARKCSQGLGIFIAPDITRLVFFPFSVNEIILVADSFEIREVLRLRQYLSPYYVLHLDNLGARLWIGHADHIQEIRDGQFPAIYIPETDKKPSGAERKILRAKVEAGVKSTAHKLSKYFSGSAPTLLFAGDVHLVRLFKKYFNTENITTGQVQGDFRMRDAVTLARQAWKACTTARERAMDGLIEKLMTETPRFRARGLRQVWRAALDKKGLLLLVEKDFKRPAYVPEGTQEIRLHPPTGKYKYVADAVDDVIEKVLAAGGHVVLTEEHRLGKFENIGMMLRY